jgi:hypothetical protein
MAGRLRPAILCILTLGGRRMDVRRPPFHKGRHLG